jgi:hypothetical protein
MNVLNKWGEAVCAAPVAGSDVQGTESRYCIKSRDCNVYLQLLASQEGLYFVEIIASVNIKYSSYKY